MRIVYLCKADPPPPASDFHNVLEFFKTLPDYLHPRMRDKVSNHMLYFADRVGNKWLTEFHDFAVAFVSGRFLTDPKALECLKFTSDAFPNMVCIDLYDNLSDEQKSTLGKYTTNIYSLEEGKNFLLNAFPDERAASKEEAAALEKSIETEGYDYLKKTIESLDNTSRSNKLMSCLCYLAAMSVLCFMVWYIIYGSFVIPAGEKLDLYVLIYECVKLAVLSGVLIALTRFLFLLGKSFMVESIRFSDRAHAIGLGKLYLQLYKSKFEWAELKDVLQNWNIDKGSAFMNLDAKDIEAVSLDKIVSSFNK